MAALNRFISRLKDRGLPFFKLLKRQDKFQWMEEAERALQDLKHHLQSPPVLTAPLPGEDLLLYITATTHVVSSAIVVELARKAMHLECRVPCTSSARYSPNPRYDTR
jgi:deferrochelatase/peroxidase EfeB